MEAVGLAENALIAVDFIDFLELSGVVAYNAVACE